MSSFFDEIDELLEWGLFGPRSEKRYNDKDSMVKHVSQLTPFNPEYDVKTSEPINTNTRGIIMNKSNDLVAVLEESFKGVQIDDQAKTAIIRTIMLNVKEFNSTSHIQQKLDILYQHEKNYLNLIKEFKEEIKFVSSMQEELRKERSRFFSDTLKEVTKSLDDAKVSDDVASQWLRELVSTYTRSLDLSSGLLEEHTADAIGEIREQVQTIVNKVPAEKQDEEPI